MRSSHPGTLAGEAGAFGRETVSKLQQAKGFVEKGDASS